MSALDLRTIPLRGMHLVEASAGTGKTWSIVRLYLRLLLEDVAGQEPLTVDRIVVVTYTVAATEELRGRIRELLRQALDHLEERKPLEIGDQVTAELLGRCPDAKDAIARLNAALLCLDEARISTIHGYCLHALKDNAFESGSPFDPELQPEEDDLRRRAMEDFWRRAVTVLPEAEAERLCAMWLSPAALLRDLNSILTREGLCLVPENASAELAEQENILHDLFGRLCVLWPEERERLESLLLAGTLKQNIYRPDTVHYLLAEMDAFVTNAQPTALPSKFELLSPTKLASGIRKNQAVPSHPCFDLCGRIAEVHPQVARLGRADWLARAFKFCRQWLEKRKHDEERLHFDDLLSRLAGALEGERGKALARVLRQQAPVALIDEFQDTDPLQWKIFSRIYQGHPACGLYLIGDPKQAIYAFRGADIFSYIQARRDIGAGNHHTLLTNWRAHSRLVQAVNCLFERVNAPFISTEIPFEPAVAGGNADKGDKTLTIDSLTLAPMRLRLLEPGDSLAPVLGERDGEKKKKSDALGITEARLRAAKACAEDIKRLLDLGAAGRARLGKKPLVAGDIGVLVYSHHEGSQVQRELGLRGIASVSLSRKSVFATDEARDLAIVLAALVESRDESLQRAALATPFMGRTAGELHGLAEDEAAWAQSRERLLELRERWQRQGFMSAFLALLYGEEIPAQLRRLPDGERRLTNVLQLGELLQEESLRQSGPEGLLRWFAAQLAAPSRESEAQQLRLENDEKLVRIVTIHKSKGLQYPVVFLPFFAFRHTNEKNGAILLYHEEATHKACADLGSEELEAHRQLARRENLAQEMRLFYVAVTRAEQFCVLTWGKVKDVGQTAPARLLHPVEDTGGEPQSRIKEMDPAAVRQELLALARESGGAVALIDAGAEVAGTEQAVFPAPTPKELPRLAARVFRGVILRDWQAMSYTRLAHGSETERPETSGGATEAAAVAEDDAFRLTGGVRLGNLLHCLLETLDFSATDEAALRQVVRGLLPRFGLDTSQEEGLARLVSRVLKTSIQAESKLALCSLSRQDTKRELKFNFSVTSLDAAGLLTLLRDDRICAQATRGLRFEQFHGLMTGSIDLLFRTGDRYHIADYKSNHLGNRWADYGAAGLQRAMDEHRYVLQCLIYTVALHRYLHGRLQDYDYERHIGEVYYLFLRGMHPERGPDSGVWHWRPPRGLVERLDQLFAGKVAP